MNAFWSHFETLRARLAGRGHAEAAADLAAARDRYDNSYAAMKRLSDDLGEISGKYADGWAEMDREDLFELSLCVSRAVRRVEKTPGDSTGMVYDEERARAMLKAAKDAFLEAGLCESPARRKRLYARAAELFDMAAWEGPIPRALQKYAEAARERSR